VKAQNASVENGTPLYKSHDCNKQQKILIFLTDGSSQLDLQRIKNRNLEYEFTIFSYELSKDVDVQIMK